jgi:mitochondrial fission protein ELM1
MLKIFWRKSTVYIDNVDKKAYLSALSLAKYIVVTCDSTQ